MNTKKELIAEVEVLVEDVKKTHRYSMSRIYGLHNRVFDRGEKPQSCASCLIRKVRELTVWLDAVRSEDVAQPKSAKKRVSKRALKKE